MSVLVGKKAPDFSADAVVNGGEFVENFTLSQYKGKYVILFFYPLDFTFVCPTEIIAFQNSMEEFEKRGVQVIGVSTDSKFSHWAWLNTDQNNGGIKGVKYPLVADQLQTISADYDVLVENGGIAYRGLFLIDPEGIVRHQVVNDLPLGRSVKETLRMVDALQFTEKHGEVCPADWEEGKDAMKPTADGVADYLSNH
jgi:peroxiredoxin (alkyl hydroperoxide reductase subunit C)